MTEHDYEYYTHVRCKRQYHELNYYIQEQFEDKPTPQAITDYTEYLKERFQEHPPSIFDLPESEYHMPDDGRYPSEQFLISLSETILQITAEKFRQIMGKVVDAWYDFCDPDTFVQVDDENMTYTLNTGGWSGNEDIIDALLSNVCISPAMDVHNDGAVWTFKYRLLDGPK